MGRSVESDLLCLALVAGFVAACNSEPIATATHAAEPSQTPFPTATDTQTPQSSRTFTPMATLTRTLTSTPDIRTPAKCRYKPDVSPEMLDYLSKTEIFYGNRSRKVMLLTYDDLGSEVQVGKILDGLAKYGAKASFFITGWMFQNAPNAVRRIAAEGHVLAVHSWGHSPFPSLTTEQIDDDFCKFFEASEKVIPGYQYYFFRFPYGSRNDLTRKQIASWGLMDVMWSDTSGGASATDSYNQIISRAENGKIVLSHMERNGDVDAVEAVVKKLTDMGYSLESLATGLR